MNLATVEPPSTPAPAQPACSAFGVCGGCRYQDQPYVDELAIKQQQVRALFVDGLGLSPDVLEPITPSPVEYGYRNGLDLSFIRTKRDGKNLLGFMKERSDCHIVTIDDCPIARTELGRFLPELREAAAAAMPPGKRSANLVIKASGDGRVRWGGIGRGSLDLTPSEFLWADVCGKRIYFALSTFFQANTAILPKVIERMGQWAEWDRNRTFFYDLYAGVGLFGFVMADRVKRVVMIESAGPSMQCARHTLETGLYMNVDVREGRTEAEFPRLMAEGTPQHAIALVDPPRRGLSPEALEAIASAPGLETLFYLSCGPESLQRDLKAFQKRGWTVKKIAAFDFFPKTKHIETLALLVKPSHA